MKKLTKTQIQRLQKLVDLANSEKLVDILAAELELKTIQEEGWYTQKDLSTISLHLKNSKAYLYKIAREAAIEKVNCEFFGENFPQRLASLYERFSIEPDKVAEEALEWLGQSHPDTMRLRHAALIEKRKKLKQQ